MTKNLLETRQTEIAAERYHAVAIKTDWLFAGLLVFEWIIGIVFSIVLSPLTWSGAESELHLHVYAAVILGAAIAMFPIYLVWQRPGATLNRMVIAFAQMLFSILLIHLTGGRIETHFHIFVSLAFLSAYRDWRPIAIATVVTVLDHFVRGALWPVSIYGVVSAGAFRAFEHAAWVVFEDVILLYMIRVAAGEIASIAATQAILESRTKTLLSVHEELANLNNSLEAKVLARTRELEDSQRTILQQQQNLMTAGKMSALGEMAGGVAHEINNPLAIIGLRVERLQEQLREEKFDPAEFAQGLNSIGRTVDRIAKIVLGLKFFAREGRKAPAQSVRLASLIEDTLSFCRERFKNHGIDLRVVEDDAFSKLEVECQMVEISQVLLNLLNNAYDAIEGAEVRWIEIRVVDVGEDAEIRITDSGPAMTPEVREKLMQPFFTTKSLGKGTGLGLSISKGIIEHHDGTLTLLENSKSTCFVVRLPKIGRAGLRSS